MVIEKAARVRAGKAPVLPFQPPIEGMLPAYCRADGVIDHGNIEFSAPQFLSGRLARAPLTRYPFLIPSPTAQIPSRPATSPP
jgi:hypothetical protein